MYLEFVALDPIQIGHICNKIFLHYVCEYQSKGKEEGKSRLSVNTCYQPPYSLDCSFLFGLLVTVKGV